MSAKVYKADRSTEFYTPERCYITEVANTSDDESLSVAIARVEPGVTTAWHTLSGTDERYLIISGHGLMETESFPPEPVGRGDVIRIPAGCRQRITNTGDDDLEFYAVCTPRFTPECYSDEE